MMKAGTRMRKFMRGEKTDKVPFVQYDNIGGKNEEIWEEVGRDAMGIAVWTDACRLVTEHCRIDTETIADRGKAGFRDTLHTPAGSVFQERFPIPGLPGVFNIDKHYITDLDEYRVLLAYLADIQLMDNREGIEQTWRYVGDDGLPHIHIGRTPFQQLWIQWVSMMDLSFHLADDPQLIQEVMTVMGQRTIEAARIAASLADKVEIPYIVIGDNITSPLIGPERFSQYCVPYYRQVSSILADKGIPLIVHMDGDLKPLRHLIADSGVGGLDSFSPPPDNDTSAGEAVEYWPGMRLMLNFPSSVHLQNEEAIYRKACEILEEAGGSGRLQIQISEDPPSGCWRKSYPQIIRAIDDYR